MTTSFSWQTLLVFVLLHFVLQGQTCLFLQVSLEFLLLHSNPPCRKGHLSFFLFFFLVFILEALVGLHRNRSASASSALLVGAQTWIAVILYGLPWKRTKIILSFLRLHPSIAFQTLLLTVRVTSFLLRDSCLYQ